MASPRPTIRSLAAEAGVSVATVSFALRGSREVSPETQARIQRLANERGYRPDPHVSKLMNHLRSRAPSRATANICGLGQPWHDMPARNDYYIAGLLAGLRGSAESLGYSFSTLNLDDYPEKGKLQRALVTRGIEGILILPMRKSADLSARLDWDLFSTVAVTTTVLAPGFHRVTPNQFDNMIRACRELTALGYRRIGLAMSKDWDVRANHRWAAGVAWQNQFGGTEPVEPLIDETPGPNLDADRLANWLVRERPDAVIIEALNYSVIDRARRTVPAQQWPKVVTMSWPNPCADFGIDQRPERIGTVAVEMLASMLARGEKGIPDHGNLIMIDGQWINGPATGTGA
jgi:DNA-binding LacI/PurR family transcriptional regulator